MSLACLLIRPGLERAALAALEAGDESAGPRLSEHLADCDACRSRFNDLSRLASELSGVLSTPDAGADFVGAVWQRIDRAQTARPAPPFRLRTGVAIAIGLALVVLVARLWPAAPPPAIPIPVRSPSVAMTSPTRNEDGSQSNKGADTPTERKWEKGFATRSNGSAERVGAVRRRLRHRHRRRHPVRGPHIEFAIIRTPLPVRQAARPRWASWGAWFEARGDYLKAAAAYGRAYEERSDPSLAFAAGRSAECAGDVAQAVDYYAQLLSRKPEANKQPEKGSLLWLHDHDAV